ncbi:hypothetical protein EBR16_09645 [bacterium]|nr:hypothetical protein [bacterium]
MSGRPCAACGREIPAAVFVQRGAVFCPFCAADQFAVAAPALSADAVAQGHPKVRRLVEGDMVTYETRMGSCFGWFWLLFTIVHCGFMFYGLSQGNVKVNGRMVAHPEWWYFVLLALFYTPFFIVGFAFTVSRYSVRLSPAELRVRWRFLPGLGWTWELPAGAAVRTRLAYRGAEENDRPVAAIVVSSDGREIDFGSFLAKDVKDFLRAAIVDYYGDAPAAAAPADFLT